MSYAEGVHIKTGPRAMRTQRLCAELRVLVNASRMCAFFSPPVVCPLSGFNTHARYTTTRCSHPEGGLPATCNNIPAGVVVRRARRSDIPNAVGVLSRAFAREDGFVRKTASSPIGRMLGARRSLRLIEFLSRIEFAQQLRSRIKESGDELAAHALLVAVEPQNDRIVGCVEMGAVDAKSVLREGVEDQIRAWSRGGVRCKGDVYMGNLAVAGGWRRRGVGGKLVSAVMDEARDLWDARVVWAHVADDNYRAKRLYKRLGFGCAAQEPTWYPEIGRERRLFLYRSTEENAATSEDWYKARVLDMRKMNFLEYLRYCFYDLGLAKKQNEARARNNDLDRRT